MLSASNVMPPARPTRETPLPSRLSLKLTPRKSLMLKLMPSLRLMSSRLSAKLRAKKPSPSAKLSLPRLSRLPRRTLKPLLLPRKLVSSAKKLSRLLLRNATKKLDPPL